MQKMVKIHEKCPICSEYYTIESEFTIKSDSLTNIMVQPHESCGEFIIILDHKGELRGTLVLEKKDMNSNSLQQYSNILDIDENSVIFYYIQNTRKEKNPLGTLVTTDSKYHEFIHGEFFKKWLENFSEANRDFSIMTTQEIILATISLNKEIRVSFGFYMEKLIEKNIPINSMNEALKWLKEMCLNLSKKLIIP